MKSALQNIPALKRNRGFTLLELLLAFVVFALSFAVVMEVLSGAMRNTVRARNYTEAALIAQSVMDQVGLDIPLLEGTQAQGESGEYEWNLDIYIYGDTEQNSQSIDLAEMTGIALLEVGLQISWGRPPRERTVEFKTVKSRLISAMQEPSELPGVGARVSN